MYTKTLQSYAKQAVNPIKYVTRYVSCYHAYPGHGTISQTTPLPQGKLIITMVIDSIFTVRVARREGDITAV